MEARNGRWRELEVREIGLAELGYERRRDDRRFAKADFKLDGAAPEPVLVSRVDGPSRAFGASPFLLVTEFESKPNPVKRFL